MSIPKEKHTKEQMMRLLDRAIEQEESLLEKVKMLESELADCHKKRENPRHELDEQALPGSKVSFRLDFYRTEEKGPFKGIVEHLSTRESYSFEGTRMNEVAGFVAQFVRTGANLQEFLESPSHPMTSLVFPPEIIENTLEMGKKERSPLLKKLFPEFFGTPSAHLPPKLEIAEAAPNPQQLDTEPFLVLKEGVETHQRAMHSGQAFQIQIPMHRLDALQGKPCSMSFFAKLLEKKTAKPFEMVKYLTPNQNPLNIPVPALMEQGVYRLVVSMTLRDEPQKSYYQGSRLLLVQ